jgi:hypothetical protein
VNIQHPNGQWPNINGESRPRSATLAITKDDGGVIGTWQGARRSAVSWMYLQPSATRSARPRNL